MSNSLFIELSSPSVGLAFKLHSSDENKNSLISFLNAILRPVQPIVHVDILNPYNHKEYLDDKYSIVDIKALDTGGTRFQIELQI